jgi:hypothetical protein
MLGSRAMTETLLDHAACPMGDRDASQNNIANRENVLRQGYARLACERLAWERSLPASRIDAENAEREIRVLMDQAHLLRKCIAADQVQAKILDDEVAVARARLKDLDTQCHTAKQLVLSLQVQLASSYSHMEEHDDDTCPVCCEGLLPHKQKTDQAQVLVTICGHVLHRACLAPWLAKSNSCPICRAPLLRSR